MEKFTNLQNQFESLKKRLITEGTPCTNNNQDYRKLYMEIYRCKKKIVFENLHTIEETYFL
jgi:hypothetical protein